MANAIAVVQPTAPDLRKFLEDQRARIGNACAKLIDPQRMIQVASLVVYRNPELAKCDRASILASVLQACTLGLDLTPSAGEGYLIPRWNSKAQCNECQFQIGYQGLVKIAISTGEVSYVQGRVVYQYDEFDWHWDPDLKMSHRPSREDDPGPITHAYAVAKLANGEFIGSCLSRSKVEDYRRRSKAAGSGPWVTDWDAMAVKTAVLRLTKWLPKSPRLADALDVENQEYIDATHRVAEAPPPSVADTRVGRMTQELARQAQDIAVKAEINATFTPQEQAAPEQLKSQPAPVAAPMLAPTINDVVKDVLAQTAPQTTTQAPFDSTGSKEPIADDTFEGTEDFPAKKTEVKPMASTMPAVSGAPWTPKQKKGKAAPAPAKEMFTEEDRGGWTEKSGA